MVEKRKKTKELEPQWYASPTNIPDYNYKVYYMSALEKILYFMLAFAAGAAVGYLFYGGIGKDEYGDPTTVTKLLDILIPGIVGILAGKMFVPVRNSQIIDKNRRKLNSQFRDMLEAFTTSLGAGKNVRDSFKSVYDDLKVQYDEEAFILKELEIIIDGMNNNVDVEELLMDFGIRSGNDDIYSFANVFKISFRKGGNIKDTIRNTHEILNDKMEINEDIETIVTSNKTEQNIMILMPIALIAMIKMISADFAANFTTPIGIISTTIAVIMFVAAYFIGRAILNIKV
ncbi:MAG: hypothetical protein K2N34_09150 [Lachnospiraceae bacterium]|nr:hypothetical protein [Lachnospiraceae bacterium]